MNLISTMRLNAASCVIFGAIFALIPGSVGLFLGDSPIPPQLLMTVGGVLILNGIHIIWAASDANRASKWRIYFSLGDFAWVAATAVLIITGYWITSTNGVVASIAVAAMVGFFGVRQLTTR